MHIYRERERWRGTTKSFIARVEREGLMAEPRNTNAYIGRGGLRVSEKIVKLKRGCGVRVGLAGVDLFVENCVWH